MFGFKEQDEVLAKSVAKAEATTGELMYGTVATENVPSLKPMGHKDTKVSYSQAPLYTWDENDDLVKSGITPILSYADMGGAISLKTIFYTSVEKGKSIHINGGKRYLWSSAAAEAGVLEGEAVPENIVPLYSNPLGVDYLWPNIVKETYDESGATISIDVTPTFAQFSLIGSQEEGLTVQFEFVQDIDLVSDANSSKFDYV